MIDVEFPLIEVQLKAIDQQLERAITDLNWISEGALFIYYNDRYNHKEVLLLQEKMYTYTGEKAYHRGYGGHCLPLLTYRICVFRTPSKSVLRAFDMFLEQHKIPHKILKLVHNQQ